MTTTSAKKAVVLLTFVSLLVASCVQQQTPAPAPSTNQPRADAATATACGPVTLTIDPKSSAPPWVPPSDIPGGAQSANLQSASVFAWQEFIALNWPAAPQNGQLNTRDQPDPNAIFGDPKYSGAQAAGPLVWHTFRHKVEIFPGTGAPHGYASGASKLYGYDEAPQYVYPNGQIPPFGTASKSTPWINLDEQSEIGLDTMFAGNAPNTPFPGQQILFLAKANRAEYLYVATNGWWTQGSSGYTRNQAIAATKNYIASFNNGNPPGPNQKPIEQYAEPQPGSTTQPAANGSLVSLPNNTIEIKSGWRQLTNDEINSGRFYTTTVRYYQSGSNGVGYVDAVWGMVALHIIQKTPSAPYFIYATFSQADNLLDENGNKIEDENGKLNENGDKQPLDPNVTSKNATSANPPTPQSIQQLSPQTSTTQPGKRVYYSNTPNTPDVQGLVALNRREHNIPQCVIDVNTAAHAAITAYNKQNKIGDANGNSVWNYYKLVNVQYQPFDKPAGVTYAGTAPDPSTYYQANEMVESDYNLQVFSGQFQSGLTGQYSSTNVTDLITDFNSDGTVFRNTYYSTSAQNSGKAANMGGCMGCHANAQVAGSDFSFIFKGGAVQEGPEVAVGPTTVSPQGVAKFNRLLLQR